MSKFCDELWVVKESKVSLKFDNNKKLKNSNIMAEYFDKVSAAQNKIFDNELVNENKNNIKILSIKNEEINKLSLNDLKDYLKSDLYIVFGSSYIKGPLVDFLIQQKAINIHAGVSPYYRGSDCNFWALYDDNPHLVGSTIHLLSKGLDNGPILYHAMSNIKSNPYEYTMSTIKSAFHSIVERIKNDSIFKIEPLVQIKSKEIRYSKKSDFDEGIVKKYFKKEINLNKMKFDISILKDPFFLN